MFQRQKEGLLESIPEDIEGESNEKEVEVAENVFFGNIAIYLHTIHA